jgi:hypothetical protein
VKISSDDPDVAELRGSLEWVKCSASCLFGNLESFVTLCRISQNLGLKSVSRHAYGVRRP